MIYVGIDPGASGGFGFVPVLGEPWAVKMPGTIQDIWNVLADPALDDCFALLEKVQPMPAYRPKEGEEGEEAPRHGTISAFKLGASFGRLEMALTANGMVYEKIHPAKWKRLMGVSVPKGSKLTQTQRKNIAKQRAQELFPKLKITHAISEALLLAELARRQAHAQNLPELQF